MPDPRTFRRLHLASVCALALCAGSAGTRAATPSAADQRSAIFQQIATAGNAATVGIYCERGPLERYYGTGAVVTADGYILTSTTVVPPGSKKIRVYFTDQSHKDAALVELDETVEATLLKVEAADLAHLPVATDLPEVGERAYTFGNAHNMIRTGEHASFSVGVISGVYPVTSADGQSSYAGIAIETDAAINPGQDGGPLLNSRGQLLGVISLSYSDTRWQGMTAPITRVRKALRACQDGTVALDEAPLLAPPAADTAAGNPFAGHAKALQPALVSLAIERKYPSEDLPRYNWRLYKQKLEHWDDLHETQKRRIAADFFRADRILGANQQLRRPDTAVTGLLVSADGWILTSAFNLQPDRAFVDTDGGIRPVAYEGDLGSLLSRNRANTKQRKNPVTSVTATLHDGRTLPAKIVARHKPLGVALLRVEAADLPHVDLADRMTVPRAGQAVGVVGVLPANESFTLNTGMVSAPARHRDLRMQCDALFNYGNSGGPVFLRDGRIVGFAGAPMRPGPVLGRLFAGVELQQWHIAPNSGISLAARADRVLRALPALQAGADVDTLSGAYIGVGPDPNRAFGTEVIIGRVAKGSPGDAAGLRKGDAVLALDSTPLTSWKHFIAEVAEHEPGDVVQLTIRRKGGCRYLEIAGQRVERERDLKELFKTLEHGDEIEGRYVRITEDVFDIEVTLGERE